MGYSSQGRKASDTTERLHTHTHTHHTHTHDTHTRETEAGEGEQSTLRKRRSPLEGQDSEEERLRKEASLTFNAIYNLWLTRRRTSSGRRSD